MTPRCYLPAARAWRRTAVLAVLLALGGCARTSVTQLTESALDDAQAAVGIRGQFNSTGAQQQAAAAQVDLWLARPLAPADAVRIALTHSPSLQALLAESQAQQAAALASGRLTNPVFTFERLLRGDDKDIGRMLSFGLTDLLSWPWRSQIADARVEQGRLAMVAAVVEATTATRQAWIQAVAAEQSVRYFEDVRTAAEAAAELARRMQGAGNFSALQRAREQAFYADAVTRQARAQMAAAAARERLVRLLGLDAAQAQKLKLPDRLADLPREPRGEPAIREAALDRRLDLKLARAQLETTARAQGLGRWTSWAGGVHVGLQRNSETGEPTQRGFEVEVPIPLLDPGDARRAADNAAVRAAVQRTRQVALAASSQLRETYHAYRTSYDVARHYRDEIVPLRKTIAEENLYRYNGMLIGVFELLADARAQIGSVIAALDAQRDFWLADAALDAVLIGRPATLPMATAVAAGATPEAGH